MEPLKQIMCGVADFARMRGENASFVGRTALHRTVLASHGGDVALCGETSS